MCLAIVRETFFWFPSFQCRRNGRAGGCPKKTKESEISRKRSAGAADDQGFSKIARPKKTRDFRPPQNEGGLTGTKKAFPKLLRKHVFLVPVNSRSPK